MKKIIVSFIGLLIIILVVIGIFMNKGKDNSKNNLTKITVAEVAHSIFYAPMYAADSLGYFEEEGLDPDMLLLGKALGNGIHVGAALMKEAPEDFYRLALVGGAGDTEFIYAAGCAVFEELLENGLLEHISEVSNYLEEKLLELLS